MHQLSSMTASGIAAWLLAHSGSSALVLARVAGLAWAGPALATPGLGWRFRLALAVLLVAVLLPVVEPMVRLPEGEGAGLAALARACVVEVVIGAALGWSAALVVAGARQAGEVVGLQAGLSPAALLDPEAGDELTPLGHLYALVALAVFLALDGPLVLVKGLVESYRVLPAGEAVLSDATARLAFGRVGEALALAVRLAAPTALALALAGIALGLLGRAAPSLQLMALSLPVRWVLGLILVFLGLIALAGSLAAVWRGWLGDG
jgi:flagellar biosynthetic protein FliR